jgi:hypothetical protein
MSGIPYFAIMMIVACAIFFHRAAEFEDESSLLWTGLSVLVSIVSFFAFHWGWLGCLLGQVGLFAGITIFRILRKP